MKIALCISGQPRSAIEAYPSIYQNIIVPNQADVFIHMNYSKKTTYIEKSHMEKGIYHLPECIDEEIIQLYKPIAYLVEEPKDFLKPTIQLSPIRLKRSMEMNAHKNWTEEEHRAHHVRQLMSMYYSIFKCNELKETYANEHHFVYDYVIRIRFDAKPQRPLYCREFDPGFIHYQELHQPDQLISDWINFGSNIIMNIYSSIYFMMEYLNTFQYLKKEDRQENTYEPSDTVPGCSEYFIRDIMTLYRIPKRAFSIDCVLL